MKAFEPDKVIHLAAGSHVDRSKFNPAKFVRYRDRAAASAFSPFPVSS